VIVLPKVISAVYSYEDMKEKWNQDNPDNPYSRRDELQQGIYSLDKWLIRVDDNNKTIATIGWKEYPSHTVVGGLLAANRANPKRPEFEQGLGKNERALQSAREPQLNQSKPLIAAFGAREGSPEAWIQRGRDRGWVFSQDEEFNQIKSSIPESVTNEWNGAYPNGNWAIRPITDAESLSKWVFIDDPTPSWFDMLKSKQGGWRDILKVMPPSPPFVDYGSYPEADNTHVNDTPQIYYMGNIAVIVRGHYLNRVKGGGSGHGTRDRNTDELLNWVECVKGKPNGNYFMYRTKNPHDYQTIMIDIIGKGQIFPNSFPVKQLGIDMKNPETGDVIVSVIIFTNYFNRSYSKPTGRKFVACNGVTKEKKHPAQRKTEKIKERQEFNPFDPVQAEAKRKKLAEENKGRSPRRNNRRYRR
tara:strand:- start:124 stop:1368 length:1245 start_codon:yes stop_codon:yes gene_type:complete